jgi:hypothetical protein
MLSRLSSLAKTGYKKGVGSVLLSTRPINGTSAFFASCNAPLSVARTSIMSGTTLAKTPPAAFSTPRRCRCSFLNFNKAGFSPKIVRTRFEYSCVTFQFENKPSTQALSE